MNRLDGDAVARSRCLSRIPSTRMTTSTSSFPMERSCWARRRRSVPVRLWPAAPHGSCLPSDDYAGWILRGSRPVPRPRPDRRRGLEGQGEQSLPEIFGASIALGVIAGAGEITQGGGAISTSGSQAFTNGAAGSVSQSATSILDRFIQIPPTITIREGHRVKVYFTQDMLLACV